MTFFHSFINICMSKGNKCSLQPPPFKKGEKRYFLMIYPSVATCYEFFLSVSACFHYDGTCLRDDTGTVFYKFAALTCAQNGSSLLRVSSDETDFQNRLNALHSNSVNFPFWIDCHLIDGAWRSGDMVFYGSGDSNNVGHWGKLQAISRSPCK